MSSRLSALAAGLTLAMACGAESPVAPESAGWLNTLIQQIQAEPVRNPPAVVTRYAYNGQTVYYVSERCCDIWSELYAADGTLMCHPSGGVTGRGDGKCPDFLAARRNEHVVWRDSRTR